MARLSRLRGREITLLESPKRMRIVEKIAQRNSGERNQIPSLRPFGISKVRRVKIVTAIQGTREKLTSLTEGKKTTSESAQRAL